MAAIHLLQSLQCVNSGMRLFLTSFSALWLTWSVASPCNHPQSRQTFFNILKCRNPLNNFQIVMIYLKAIFRGKHNILNICKFELIIHFIWSWLTCVLKSNIQLHSVIFGHFSWVVFIMKHTYSSLTAFDKTDFSYFLQIKRKAQNLTKLIQRLHFREVLIIFFNPRSLLMELALQNDKTLLKMLLTFNVLLCLWSSLQSDSSLLRARMALLCSLCRWTFSFITWDCFFCKIFICFWKFRLSSSWTKQYKIKSL